MAGQRRRHTVRACSALDVALREVLLAFAVCFASFRPVGVVEAKTGVGGTRACVPPTSCRPLIIRARLEPGLLAVSRCTATTGRSGPRSALR